VRNNSEKPLVSYFTHVDVHLCGGTYYVFVLCWNCSLFVYKLYEVFGWRLIYALIGRLSTPSLQDACSDYLQKKGLSSVVFVPVVCGP